LALFAIQCPLLSSARLRVLETEITAILRNFGARALWALVVINKITPEPLFKEKVTGISVLPVASCCQG
jgi:hypothetical protein